MTLLAAAEALELARGNRLPDLWRMRVGGVPHAVVTVGTEELDVARLASGSLRDALGTSVRVGDVVCVRSGQRVTWRRVLDVRGERAFLRGDVAPFADGWFAAEGAAAAAELLGRVRTRRLDALARVSPSRVVRTNWLAALAIAQAKATKRRLTSRSLHLGDTLRTRLLAPSEWDRVQAFWRRASGRELPLTAPRAAYVVGLFAEDAGGRPSVDLVGVNVQLVTGEESYSAYTMIERGYRGVGGSRLLLDESLRVAEALEIRRVYVHIHARNVPSLAAYRRARFRFSHWWADETDPLLSAERQWRVFERLL